MPVRLLALTAALALASAAAAQASLPAPRGVRLAAGTAPPALAADTLLQTFDHGAVEFFEWQYTGGPNGYIFGSNPFYHEFGAAFEAPPGPFRVTGADVYVTHVSPTPAVDAYTLRVYGGSLEAGPAGAPLYSEVRTLSSTLPSLDTPVATPLSFGPVEVEGTFFVTLTSAEGLDVEDWAIGATQDLDEPNPYTWFFYGERWFRLDSLIGDETNRLEVFLWLDARGEAGTSAAEPGAGAGDGLVRALAASPNPLGAAGSVAFELAAAARVRVAAYDVLGREVAVLADGPYPAGRSRVGWDAAPLPPGLYVVRLEAGTERRVVRVVRG